MEAKIVGARGMKFAAIRAGKFRRNYFAGPLAKVLNAATLGPNMRDAVRTVAGVGDALRVLRRFRPAVVFLKGGFVCVPVGLAARLLRIPYVIHESDVQPGLANRLLGRWAAQIAVGFPAKYYREFDPGRLVFTGNPVRREVLAATRAEGLAHYGLEEGVPVLLVTGGSQGARQINDAILAALPALLPDYQIIHQTGEGELERVKFELSRHGRLEYGQRYHPFAFILKEMGLALAAADVVIGRAGVGTINDSAVLGKPTILIPNYQMAGHQVENARMLSRAGAARVLDGAHLTVARLVAEIKRVVTDGEERERLAKAIGLFGRPEAAVELAGVVLAVGRAHLQNEHKPNKDRDELADEEGE